MDGTYTRKPLILEKNTEYRLGSFPNENSLENVEYGFRNN